MNASPYDLRGVQPHKPFDFMRHVKPFLPEPTFALHEQLHIWLDTIDDCDMRDIPNVLKAARQRIAQYKHDEKQLVDAIEYLLCFDSETIPDITEVHRRVKALGFVYLPSEDAPVQDGTYYSTLEQAQAHKKANGGKGELRKARAILFEKIVTLQSMFNANYPDLRRYLPPSLNSLTFDIKRTLGYEWHVKHGLDAVFTPDQWHGYRHDDKRIIDERGRQSRANLITPDRNMIKALWVRTVGSVLGQRDFIHSGLSVHSIAAKKRRDRDLLEHHYCAIYARLLNEKEGKAIYRGNMLLGAYIHVIRRAYQAMHKAGLLPELPTGYEADDFQLPDYPELPTAKPDSFYQERDAYWHFVKCAIADPRTKPHYLVADLDDYADKVNDPAKRLKPRSNAQRQKAYRERLKAKKAPKLPPVTPTVEKPQGTLSYVCPFTGKPVQTPFVL